jgi:hypothetical protein
VGRHVVVSVDLVMVAVGILGFLTTMATAWQGKFRLAAGAGILTGALLVVCMFVFRPSGEPPSPRGVHGWAAVLVAG